MNSEQFETLCIKALAGELSSRQRHLLDKTIDESDSYKAQYRALETLWEDAGPAKVEPSLDAEAGWLQLEARLGLGQTTLVASRSKRGAWTARRWFARPVFTAGLAMAALVAVWLVKGQLQPEMPWKSLVTQNGQRNQMTLSDGSVVTLNSGSRLRYPTTFKGDVREVYLYGEAFFDVQSETRPFVVLTDQAKTTVLGTKFVVRARDEATQVMVASGRVRVEAAQAVLSEDAAFDEVILNPGQMSEVMANAEPTLPETVDVQEAMGWVSGRIHFEKARLAEVLAELERYYNVVIRCEVNGLTEQTLTATYSEAPVEAVVSSICLTFNLNYHTASDTLVITR